MKSVIKLILFLFAIISLLLLIVWGLIEYQKTKQVIVDKDVKVEVTDNKLTITTKDTVITEQVYPESHVTVIVQKPDTSIRVDISKPTNKPLHILQGNQKPISNANTIKLTETDTIRENIVIKYKVTHFGFTARPLLVVPITQKLQIYDIRVGGEWLWYKRWNVTASIGVRKYSPMGINYRRGGYGLGINWTRNWKGKNGVDVGLNFYFK